MNFTIKKGRHYSELLPVLLKESHFGFYKCSIWFNEILPDQDYYNKLIGFGCLNPRIRSERIGWRFKDGEIEVCIYSETDHVFQFIQPFKIPIQRKKSDAGLKVEFNVFLGKSEIYIEDPFITFRASYHTFTEPKCKLPLFLCKPYHGGNPKAAQEYKIFFEYSKLNHE
jgi:hypothetical protein